MHASCLSCVHILYPMRRRWPVRLCSHGEAHTPALDKTALTDPSRQTNLAMPRAPPSIIPYAGARAGAAPTQSRAQHMRRHGRMCGQEQQTDPPADRSLSPPNVILIYTCPNVARAKIKIEARSKHQW